eukprot:jgi/Mesen1/4503/ME000023S03880
MSVGCGLSARLLRSIHAAVRENPAPFSELQLRWTNWHRDQLFFQGKKEVSLPAIHYIRDGTPYHYQGTFDALGILEATSLGMHRPHRRLPFERVTSVEQTQQLVNSTARALVLVDRCGWGAAYARKEQVRKEEVRRSRRRAAERRTGVASRSGESVGSARSSPGGGQGGATQGGGAEEAARSAQEASPAVTASGNSDEAGGDGSREIVAGSLSEHGAAGGGDQEGRGV